MMAARYDDVRYELLRPEQVKARREAAPVAYIVAGSLEWHGWHNPLGTDSLKAHAICCEAARRYGGVVLPPFYQGLVGDENWGPDGWRGYTLGYNRDAVFEAAMLGIVRALVYGEWKVIMAVTGHDHFPQRDAMRRALEAGLEGTDAVGVALMEGELHERSDALPYSMDHAAAWETSCMMHVCPESVDLKALDGRCVSTGELFEMLNKDGSISPEGIGGLDPRKHASEALGALIVSTMADHIGKKAIAMLNERRTDHR